MVPLYFTDNSRYLPLQLLSQSNPITVVVRRSLIHKTRCEAPRPSSSHHLCLLLSYRSSLCISCVTTLLFIAFSYILVVYLDFRLLSRGISLFNEFQTPASRPSSLLPPPVGYRLHRIYPQIGWPYPEGNHHHRMVHCRPSFAKL